MKFMPTDLPDVIRIEPTVHGDERGFFMETWQARRFSEAGIGDEFVQDNFSHSSKGILRGLHYQIERAQGKLAKGVAYPRDFMDCAARFTMHLTRLSTIHCSLRLIRYAPDVKSFGMHCLFAGFGWIPA